MQLVCSNDAKIMSYDFKNRSGYRDTYSVLWSLKRLGPGSLSEHPGSDWDKSWLLKMPLTMISISSFLMNFPTFVLSLPALSNPCFVPSGLLM